MAGYARAICEQWATSINPSDSYARVNNSYEFSHVLRRRRAFPSFAFRAFYLHIFRMNVYTHTYSDTECLELYTTRQCKPTSYVNSLVPPNDYTFFFQKEENYYSKTFENTRKADSELCDYVNHTEEITPVPAPTSPPPTHHRSTLLLNRASPGVPFTSPCPESEFSIDGHGIEHLEFVGSPTHGLVEVKRFLKTSMKWRTVEILFLHTR